MHYHAFFVDTYLCRAKTKLRSASVKALGSVYIKHIDTENSHEQFLESSSLIAQLLSHYIAYC